MKRPSSTSLIVLGSLLGGACGLIFGPYCDWLKGVGDAYVGLLQMTVLPYVTCSLVGNVGRLSLQQGRGLAWAGLRVMLLLWLIGLLSVVAMSWTFPPWPGGSFYSAGMVQEPEATSFLDLFVPSNPFRSLAQNYVPAVVVFSLGLGAALSSVKDKERLLENINRLVEGLGQLNRMVVKISPIGMFAIVAYTASTITLQQFVLIQGYLLAYGGASLLLTFGVVPVLIAGLTPFSYRDVLLSCKDALLTAFVIGNTFVVLPMIVDAVESLYKRQAMEVDHDTYSPAFIIPLAYPFPDLGRIVGLVFIPFAAWFYGTSIAPEMLPSLVGVGVVGSFAKPVVTMPLLLRIAELPSDIFNLYLSSGVIASRFGDLMKAMHLIAFTIITSAWMRGELRLRSTRLGVGSIGVALATVVTLVGIRTSLDLAFKESHGRDQMIESKELLYEPTDFVVLDQSGKNPVPLMPGETQIDRIKRRGVIRVGYDADELPFSYINAKGHLVGFDVDMAHRLAHDLGVSIEFLPLNNGIVKALLEDEIDIGMAGIEGTVKHATLLPHPPPYLDVSIGLVVKDHRRQEFASLEGLRQIENLRLAVVEDSLAEEILSKAPSTTEIIKLASERPFFENDIADALVTSVEVGGALAVRYPRFSVIRPRGVEVRVPLYYYVQPGSSNLEEMIEAWLALKNRDGTIEELYGYWVLGEDNTADNSRWYVLRDVFGWGA